ncbi:hypothetical protein LINPERHAP2_LOCUS12042 [Linum perenne]
MSAPRKRLRETATTPLSFQSDIARWTPDFNEEAPIRKVLTWVRIPKLPIQFFNFKAVERIGNHIGKTIRLDLATEEGARARYARVCVEVYLSRPLLGKYIIEDRVFYVEYESLDNICFSCGIYGHKDDALKEVLDDAMGKSSMPKGKANKTTKPGPRQSAREALSNVTNNVGSTVTAARSSLSSPDGLVTVPVMIGNPTFQCDKPKQNAKPKQKAKENSLPKVTKTPKASIKRKFTSPKPGVDACSIPTQPLSS